MRSTSTHAFPHLMDHSFSCAPGKSAPLLPSLLVLARVCVPALSSSPPPLEWDLPIHNSLGLSPPRTLHNSVFLTVGDVSVSVSGACCEDRVLSHQERTTEGSTKCRRIRHVVRVREAKDRRTCGGKRWRRRDGGVWERGTTTIGGDGHTRPARNETKHDTKESLERSDRVLERGNMGGAVQS